MKTRPSLVVLSLISLGLAACMDPLHDYGDCVKIETARCEARGRCDALPADIDVDTCVAYYEEFCRTREIDPPNEAAAIDVDACVAAIDALTCEQLDAYVAASDRGKETDTLPGCEFLWPAEEDDTDTSIDEDAGAADAS